MLCPTCLPVGALTVWTVPRGAMMASVPAIQRVKEKKESQTKGLCAWVASRPSFCIELKARLMHSNRFIGFTTFRPYSEQIPATRLSLEGLALIMWIG